MTYEIVIAEKALKQIEKLEKPIQEQIFSSLEKIRIRPESFVKKLVGMPGYRLRVVDYRIILDIDKGKLYILVVKVGHRKDVYD
ncbi:MAG: type II toxin-antitoxin system RelE/ParE family toxin [Nanoarchaeota archaeon]|nr:type II toxin-antitoxin system RelE/ParE family toxin [Nanoarchaeota archaeon]